MQGSTVRWVIIGIVVLGLAASIYFLRTGGGGAGDEGGGNPVVLIETSMGNIQLELDKAKAPITVKNFLNYVEKGHYNGLLFHRVIKDFMIQGGGFEPGMKERPTGKPIPNEAFNGLSNTRGTIAMARTNDPDSATSQFFINTVDNSSKLDKSPRNPGYCVFGKVVEGMDVVDRIREVRTHSVGPHNDVPVEDVVIKSVRRLR
jgi:cyclophilin family peptidyl-prolyl cis-trans isomerase